MSLFKFLSAFLLIFTFSCKRATSTSQLAIVGSPPEVNLVKENCKFGVISKQQRLDLGGVKIMSFSNNICGPKQLGLNDQGSDAGSAEKLAVVVVTPGAGKDPNATSNAGMSRSSSEWVSKYQQAGWKTEKIYMTSGEAMEKGPAYIEEKLREKYPNGYKGDLDVIYYGHGVKPQKNQPLQDHYTSGYGVETKTKDGRTEIFPTAAEAIAKFGEENIAGGRYVKSDEIASNDVLDHVASGLGRTSEQRDRTFATIVSCYSGTARNNLVNEDCERNQRIVNNYGSIQYSSKPEIATYGSAAADSWVEMRTSPDKASIYDQNGDGAITMTEVRRRTDKMTDRAVEEIRGHSFSERVTSSLGMMVYPDLGRTLNNQGAITVNGEAVVGYAPN